MNLRKLWRWNKIMNKINHVIYCIIDDLRATHFFDFIEKGLLPNFKKMMELAVAEYPNFRAVATTLRNAKTATVNDWGAVLYYDSEFYEATLRENLEIYDRVGGGDSFASGLIYGFLADRAPGEAVEYGAAHGALAMTTPGDTTMASLKEVEKVMAGGGARVDR